jgi:signal peptidase I
MDAGRIEPLQDGERARDLSRQLRREKDSRLSRRLSVWLIGPLATLLVTLILVFFVFFDTSTVTGPSMQPTLRDHDYVLLTKGLPDPKRGDIVILLVKSDGVTEEWVKRIVAVAGDNVDVRGDVILVNGAPEQFAHLSLTRSNAGPFEKVTVGAGQVFLAGDNRIVSEDSRFVGTFPVTSIVGRVVFIYAPLWRVGLVPGPPR